MLSGLKLPATEQLLVEGGDARIELGSDGVSNRYGCAPLPDPGLLAFGSSTATGISEVGFAAADRLRGRLLAEDGVHAVACVREFDRIRRELIDLCGVSDIPGVEAVFAASGTDLHLIAAQLAGGAEGSPTLAVMVDAAETGSHVPTALSGRHFSSRTPLGGSVNAGSAIMGAGTMEVATVPIRTADGSPRPAAIIDAEFEAMVMTAAALGRRVLLVLADVSKTGCIAPSPVLASALKRRLPDTLDVLVDACQFRIAPPTLSAYLAQEFMVAVTGSKFVTGPTFAGALLIPASAARRLRRRPLTHALRAYSSRADWPRDWEGAEVLDEVANVGLLLRWEAALQELRAFREVPGATIAAFLEAFAGAIGKRLRSNPVFEPLPVPSLERGPWQTTDCWDRLPTIFPFLLFKSRSPAGKTPLSRDQTALVYRMLQDDLSHHPGLNLAAESVDIVKLRCQFGQPVACGVKDGIPVSALRLCVSTRLVVEATVAGGRHARAVIERALAALDKTALVAGMI